MSTKSKKCDLITIDYKDNKLVNELLKIVNHHEEITTLWKVINVNALKRLKMTDHGHVHFQVVTTGALKMARLLRDAKVELSITKDFGLDYHYGELVIVLASLFHDLGMSINRSGHEEFSLILANTIMKDVLTFLPLRERTIVISEALHAIINHRSGGVPLTIEAGIMRVADALDMSQGRSRFPYKQGNIDIHSISATAIDSVVISKGEKKPLLVMITMNNSAGLFQIDELLDSKLAKSGIENYVEVQAFVTGKTEKKLIKDFLVK